MDRPGTALAGSVRTVRARLDRDTTDALLRRVPGVYRTQVNDVLLSALGRVLADWAGTDRVTVALEGHGREDIEAHDDHDHDGDAAAASADPADLSRTVGWFTTQYPVTLTLDGPSREPDWGATLKAVKEQLRAVPRRGLGYEALARLGAPAPAARALRELPLPQVCFNYHGQWRARPARTSRPPARSPAATWPPTNRSTTCWTSRPWWPTGCWS
ncbi:condensation domain-containing protein [Streptomyces lydicus]|nr:condensation domain-containing protein [Streptomyces lydicus]